MLRDWTDPFDLRFPFRVNEPRTGGRLFVSSALHEKLAQEPWDRSPSSATAQEIGRKLFIRSASAISAIEVTDNPNWEGPGADQAASDAALSVIRGLGLLNETPPVRDDLEDPRGDIIIFGGPVSSVFSRLVLGDGRGSPLLDGEHLPLEFDLVQTPSHEVYVESGFRPNWSIRQRGNLLNFPEDCLLITCLVNPYGEGEDRIINIAGRHAGGTRAIDLVLRDEVLLKRIAQVVGDSKCWQVLIRVALFDTTWRVVAEPIIAVIDRSFTTLRHLHGGEPFMSGLRDLPDIKIIWRGTAKSDPTEQSPRAEVASLGWTSSRAGTPAPTQGATAMDTIHRFGLGPRDASETDEQYARRLEWRTKVLSDINDSTPQNESERLVQAEDAMAFWYGKDWNKDIES